MCIAIRRASLIHILKAAIITLNSQCSGTHWQLQTQQPFSLTYQQSPNSVCSITVPPLKTNKRTKKKTTTVFLASLAARIVGVWHNSGRWDVSGSFWVRHLGRVCRGGGIGWEAPLVCPCLPTWNVDAMPGGRAALLWAWGQSPHSKYGSIGRFTDFGSKLAFEFLVHEKNKKP